MAKRYSGNEFASARSVTPYFSSACTVIADSATAAPHAANRLGSTKEGAPTAATNRALKGGSIIATVSGSTAAAVKRNRA